jgi:hypothetical protein
MLARGIHEVCAAPKEDCIASCKSVSSFSLLFWANPSLKVSYLERISIRYG